MNDCDGPIVIKTTYVEYKCDCGKVTKIPFLFCSVKKFKCLGCYCWKTAILKIS
jgi:hypothetical protein